MKRDGLKPDLKSDCGRCAALCCLGLSFTREDGVAIDKPAGVACPHLQGANACGIYADRAERGFAVCARYECFGAGQRVTQELFGGRSWRDDPMLAIPMMDAFARMRVVQDGLVLISEGRKLSLTDEEQRALDAIESRLNPPGGWTIDALDAAPTAAWSREIVEILRLAYRRTRETAL